MTFDELWNYLISQQPRLLEGSEMITFTVPGFRRLLKEVYESGKAEGFELPSLADVIRSKQ